MIKHKWYRIETEAEDLETHQCKVCDCKRHKVYYGGKFPEFIYTRNDIVFKMGDRPDCYGDESEPFKEAMGFFNT